VPTPAWPISLPVAPRVADLEETAPDLVVRTAMDVGPDQVRRRTTFNVTKISASMRMTRAQLATFDAFFKTDAAGGAEAFTFKHPRTGVTGVFRFVGRPSYTPITPRKASQNEHWTVKFELEEVPSGTTSIEPPPPPPDWTTLIGTTGTHTFSHSSTLAAALTSCCFATGDFYNFVTVNRTFAYARTVFTDLVPVSVVWEYVASGRTSSITYNRDGGWSFVLDAAHFGTTDCPGATPFRPTSQSEGLYLRHRGLPEIVSGGTGQQAPSILCPGAFTQTLDWFKCVDATLTNGPLNAPVDRARGFRAYAAICRTQPPPPGGGTGPITDTNTGGAVDTDTGVVPG
jgi:hypothetical protein